MTHDFYDLLGVPDDASQDEIKDAFRKKVQEVHPDLNDDPRAPAQFTALKKGYDTLNDPVERKAYDRLGHKDYVAKRLEGLPDPDQWKPADADDGGTTADSTASATSGSTTTGSSVGSSGASTAGAAASSAGATGSAGGATDGAGSTASASTGSSTSTRTNTRTRTATGGSTVGGTRTGTTSSETTSGGATGGGTATGGSDASTGGTSSSSTTDTSTSSPGLVERLRGINYGWPVVFLTSLVYLAGVGLYARANADALREFASAVSAAGTDTTALREALLAGEYGMASVFEFVRTTAVAGGRPGAGVLVAVGAVALPAVFFVVVRTTRRSFAWQPTYLYVVAVLTPLLGLGANAAGYDWPVLTVALFGLLPLLSVVALPFNAFVTPRLKRLF